MNYFCKDQYPCNMKKTVLSILATFMSGCLLLSAQTVTRLENNRYSVGVGDIAIIVDAAHGGKILSFTLEQDYEILSQTPFPNSFGSTFWTSPQSDWNWPPVAEFDSKPFAAEIKENALVLTGEKSERLGFRICKKFCGVPEDNAIEITYTIINESGETKKVAPWEITRVTNGGMIFFEADEITPANGMGNIPFTFKHGAAWFELDAIPEKRKINADGTGWLGFSDYGLLFVKEFPDLDKTQPAPAEAEIQIYIHSGKTYMEIEEQGPYTTLKPGEKTDWTVRWHMVEMTRPASPSKGLLNKAKKLIK